MLIIKTHPIFPAPPTKPNPLSEYIHINHVHSNANDVFENDSDMDFDKNNYSEYQV